MNERKSNGHYVVGLLITGYKMYLITLNDLGLSKEKSTEAGLEPNNALPTELSRPMWAVFLLGVPVRSLITVSCHVARDLTQVSIQSGKRQPGDYLKGDVTF